MKLGVELTEQSCPSGRPLVREGRRKWAIEGKGWRQSLEGTRGWLPLVLSLMNSKTTQRPYAWVSCGCCNKWPQTESESCSVMSDSLWPQELYSPWNSPGQNTGVGSLSLLQGIFPNPGIEPRSPNIAGGFFTSWATREAQEYWSGSLSLLQQIFPTQELNQGLLHCRWILYQLSYEGSPQTKWFKITEM